MTKHREGLAAGPLGGVRVVELGEGVMVPYAARLLADLGAVVVKLEHPDGDATRRYGPFLPGRTGPDDGALYQLLNASKLGGTLRAAARDRVAELIAGADVVLLDESQRAALAALGLDPTTPPAGIVVGIGSSVRGRPELDALHACALSGVSSMIGEPDREPLPLPYDLAAYVGGVNLAGAAVGGLLHARRTGTGQLVEVATADVLFYFMDVIGCLVTFGAERVFRNGRTMPGSGGAYPFRFFECCDGVVAVTCRSDRDWAVLAELTGRTEWLADPEWRDLRAVARAHEAAANAVLEPWFKSQAVNDLFDRAAAVGLPLAPMLSVREMLAIREADADDVVDVAGVKAPIIRNPARFERTPSVPRRSPAPTQGEMLTDEFGAAWRAAVEMSPAPADVTGAGLLAGLRVIDLAWVWSGPMVSASLADLGADVIKVEHRARLDNTRLRGRPTMPGRELPPDAPDEELSIYNHMVNRGKRSITVDMKHPDGARVLRELLLTADVVIENLPAGTFDKRGLGFSDISVENPRLVWMAMRTVGRAGELGSLRAYAPVMSSLAGVEGLVGYRGEAPVGMINFAIADPNASSYALLAVLAALVERESSGRGQLVEMAQVDALVSAMCDPIAVAVMTGTEPEILGSRHRVHSPSGHFACLGDDEWVAVLVRSEQEWDALASVVEHPVLHDPAFGDIDARRSRAGEIEAVLAGWAATRSSERAAAELLAAGVPAAPVVRFDAARQHFATDVQRVDHPYIPDEEIVGLPWRYSRTPSRIRRPAPLIGQHTREVLDELPGLAVDAERLLASDGLR